MTHPRRVAGTTFALTLAACAVAQAQQTPQVQQAEQTQSSLIPEIPWYVGAQVAYTHDSNVFRRNTDKVGDSYVSGGILGGLSLHPGRQHLYLDANAQNNHYNSLSQLDNTSYLVVGGLDWATVEHVSGTVRYATRQNLGDYSVVGTPEAKNVERGQDATATLRYGYVSQLGLEAGASWRKYEYSLTTDRDNTSNVAWIGGRYGGNGPLTLGLAGRYTKTDTPGYRPLLPLDLFPEGVLGPVDPDKSDRKDLDFTVTWVASGLSTIVGRISYTKEDHTAQSRTDFDGFTGNISWEYKPTGKTFIRSSLIRDTGNETSFLSLQQFGLKGIGVDNNRVNWIGLVEADWQATAKIVVSGMLRYLNGTVDTISGSNYDTQTTRLGLGARYNATRNVVLGCNLMNESGSGTAGTTVYSCNAQFILQ